MLPLGFDIMVEGEVGCPLRKSSLEVTSSRSRSQPFNQGCAIRKYCEFGREGVVSTFYIDNVICLWLYIKINLFKLIRTLSHNHLISHFFIILCLLIIKTTGCFLILIAHDEEHLKHLEAHGFLILQ